jgi:hypothetical protein
MPKQSRGKDLRIVEHQHIAGAQVIAQPANVGVLDSSRMTPKDKQTRGAADRWRLLCDELRRKIEVERRNVHCLRA